MQNQVMNMLMSQLKAKNPQAFQLIEQAQKNQSNPKELFNQITSSYSPNQMQELINKARNFGVPEEIINQVSMSKDIDIKKE